MCLLWCVRACIVRERVCTSREEKRRKEEATREYDDENDDEDENEEDEDGDGNGDGEENDDDDDHNQDDYHYYSYSNYSRWNKASNISFKRKKKEENY